MEIHFHDVSYIYGLGTPFSHTAVSRLTLTIPRGEFVAVMGKTGSGKTTMAQMINGLVRPTSGWVTVGSYTIAQKKENLTPLRKKIGYAFQFPEHQLFEETIYQEIAFSLKQYGTPEEEIPGRVQRAMEFVGLPYEEMRNRSPFTLSGGQMRKVALAGILVIDPMILILDEPTAGLDAGGKEELLREIGKLHRARGITILLITHHLEEALEYSERILVLKEGKLFADLRPEQVFSERERLKEAGILPSSLLRFQEAFMEKMGEHLPSFPHREKEMADALIRFIKGRRKWN